MRLFICLIIFFLFRLLSVAQCVPTETKGPFNLVCSDQFLDEDITGGIIKLSLGSFGGDNVHTFSTIGMSNEDTYLALYDGAGNLLASNDDDPNCSGCKQSTLEYKSLFLGVLNPYLIISKPDCSSLSSSINLKYNVRNDFNSEPKITSPLNVVQCAGTSALFTYNSNTVEDANPWRSSDSNIISINSATGYAEFKNPGIVRITLKGKLSCDVVNLYRVVSFSTSSINH